LTGLSAVSDRCAVTDGDVVQDAATLYLDLLERCLTRELFQSEIESTKRPLVQDGWARRPMVLVERALGRAGVTIARAPGGVDPEVRREGRDWPPTADTMIGLVRLRSLRDCVETVVRDGVPGDLIETGVWRGGASIMMRAVLAAYGVTDRTVHVADSFQGLPKPDVEQHPLDEGDRLWSEEVLAIPVAEVQRRFAHYGLLDDKVRFVEGWFNETLPKLDVDTFAILRLDGDMYGSTMDALTALYPKLAPGGFCIIDDYGAITACKAAVHDYRDANGIDEEIVQIDWTGALWRRRR
jgi:O-methyltransferase